MTVSSSSENVMLNTVRMLRRLLRNALLVTKRVMVMRLLKGSPVDKVSREGTADAIYGRTVRSEDKASVGVWTTRLFPPRAPFASEAGQTLLRCLLFRSDDPDGLDSLNSPLLPSTWTTNERPRN